MSKSQQREQSYFSAGRSEGKKIKNNFILNLESKKLLEYFVNKVPKVFRPLYIKGWYAGMAGSISNSQHKRRAKRALDRRVKIKGKLISRKYDPNFGESQL